MTFGDALKKRMEELQEKSADISKVIAQAQEAATVTAVKKAIDMTPPNADTPLRGTGTITGSLKSHWETDSRIVPEVSENEYKTILANNLHYVSYVNNGHRMDKHFVPGLVINPHNGLLEKVDTAMGGIIVGTQTDYVEGLYMREAALDVYKETIQPELDKRIKELFEE
jgi:hypothetical protein